ncbi:hypothetical protein ACFXTN_019087 [Malus domestica]
MSLSGGAAAHSPLLHCSFISSSSFASTSAFSGLSLGLDSSSSVEVGRRRGCGLVVRTGKAALRVRTTGERAMMKRQRAKGRKVLCTKSNPSSGKRA